MKSSVEKMYTLKFTDREMEMFKTILDNVEERYLGEDSSELHAELINFVHCEVGGR